MARSRVSGFQQFVESSVGQDVWVGADVHKCSYHVCLHRADGQIHTFVCPAEPRKLVGRLVETGMRIRGLTFEAGPTGFSLARAGEAAGLSVVVAAPSRIPRPSTGGAKTDRLDCVRLAAYAAKGIMRPIAIPTEQEEADRSVLRRRHQVSQSVRRTKQRIKSFLLVLGIAEPEGLKNWAKAGIEALHALSLPPSAKETMDSHLRELSFFQSELREMDARLDRLMKAEEHEAMIELLCSVPGVGPLTAGTFHFELFRPERFNRAEEVASILGLAPMVRQSGEKSSRGQLKRVGQTKLRSLLVEDAWILKAHEGWAETFYNRVLARSGLASKAIVALAHKLATILWRICVEKRPYRPASA